MLYVGVWDDQWIRRKHDRYILEKHTRLVYTAGLEIISTKPIMEIINRAAVRSAAFPHTLYMCV